MKHRNHKQIIKILVYLVLILFIPFYYFNSQGILRAQDELTTRLGIYSHYNYNLHTANFDTLPGVPNRFIQLDKGKGYGYTLGLPIGLLVEFPLNNNILLGFRGALDIKNGDFEKDYPITVLVNQIAVQGVSRYTLKTKLYNLDISPLLIIRPFGGLLLQVGAEVGSYIIKDYDENEAIINPPTGAVYQQNNLNTRNVNNGKIQNLAAINVAALGGIGYEMPLNSARTVLLVPEIFYSYGLTNIINDNYWKASNYNWKISTLSGGLSLKIALSGRKKINRTDYLIDTIQKQTNEFKKKILVRGIPVT
ncbi:MAG: hypothetical protein ABSG15_12235, partial [FCB group bacterium]